MSTENIISVEIPAEEVTATEAAIQTLEDRLGHI